MGKITSDIGSEYQFGLIFNEFPCPNALFFLCVYTVLNLTQHRVIHLPIHIIQD